MNKNSIENNLIENDINRYNSTFLKMQIQLKIC